jgi:hypothetical protein
MLYHIFDNFLDQNDFNSIKDTMLDHFFPWHYNNMKTNDMDSLYNFQFTHLFYENYKPNSHLFEMLEPLVSKINPAALIRIKANLTPLTEEKVTYDYHVDYQDIQCKTAIYYVNTNDGVTLFQDGTSVESLENRLVVFDSNVQHTGTSCTDQKVRCVINLNYFERNH